MLNMFKSKKDSEEIYLLKEILSTLRSIDKKLDAPKFQPRANYPAKKAAPEKTPAGPHKVASSFDTKEEILATLNARFEKDGITPEAIAEKTGLMVVNVHNLLTGKHNISPKIAGKFSEAFGFRKEYLVSGEKPAFPSPRKAPSNELEKSIERHYQSKFAD